MVKFLSKLQLNSNDTVFVPLCGKSLDMIYLLKHGFKIIGVELSELAIQDFFKENNLIFTKKNIDNFIVYEGENIQLYCGDVFNLNKTILKSIKGIYDRASLIALDEKTREKYCEFLLGIIPQNARWLLLTMDYPQAQKVGPPFAVSHREVKQLFNNCFCEQLEKIDDLQNEQKFIEAKVSFLEKAVYLLRKK